MIRVTKICSDHAKRALYGNIYRYEYENIFTEQGLSCAFRPDGCHIWINATPQPFRRAVRLFFPPPSNFRVSVPIPRST